jgi:PUA-domain protein
MKKVRLKAKDAQKLLEKYQVNFSKKDQVELIEDKFKIIVVNKQPAFFDYNNKWIPTLKYLQEHDLLKKITVDMGAIKFVVNGADVMRPGITDIADGIAQEDFIVIVDEQNQKPLAVGIALFSSEKMNGVSSGKVIKNIHYVGDEIWKG